jgi:predicted MFS family arabinose efflux permease
MNDLSVSSPYRDAPATTVHAGRATMAAFCATLVGIGLARFAYTPLLPALIDAHWFTPSAASYLGAATLVGYLAGAVFARSLSARLGNVWTIRAMMLLATVAFFACAQPLSYVWFFGWRTAAGFAGGALLVLAAPTALAHVAPARRGLAGGVIFMGVGVGIAASGTLVPLLLRQGLTQTWIGLGLVALALTLLAWGNWPGEAAPQAVVDTQPIAPSGAPLRAFYLEYGLNAVGLVPHMLFLVDFIVHGLHRGLAAGAAAWVVFGLGATVGPIACGYVADRIGFRATLRLAFIVQAAAALLPVLRDDTPAVLLSSVVLGAFVPGIVALALGRIQELVPHRPAAQKTAWRAAATSFATLQAVAAYGLSFLFDRRGDYLVLFVVGAAAFLLALTIEFAVRGPKRAL